jgi:NDP-sugar pyrophosphorylase family protein
VSSLADRAKHSQVVAVLQAGGRGQRLRPLTDERPKPMIEVGGVPMIERMFRQVVAAGVRRFIIVSGWQSDQIRCHLRSLTGLPADLVIRFHEEETPLGNAGAILQLNDLGNTTLFAFTDLVTSLDFGDLLNRHAASDNAITLASHLERYRLGLGELVTSGDVVVAYREKPEKVFTICSGIAVFESSFLRQCALEPPAGLVDVVSCAIEGELGVAHWMHNAWWIDVNTREALRTAEREINDYPL